MTRLEEIQAAIDTCSDEQFEELAVEILRLTTYPGLVHTSRTGDLGQDGRTSIATAHLQGGKHVTVGASKQTDLGKIKSDCDRCKAEGHKTHIFVFATPGRTKDGGYITEKTKRAWKTELKRLYGWKFDIFTSEQLAKLALDSRCENAVKDILHVAYPGGDSITTIQRAFARRTNATLAPTVPSIAEVHVGHPDLVRIGSLLRDQRNLLVFAGPGEGKSGLADSLVRAEVLAGKPVLLLDARQLASETQPKALSDHLNLNGPLEDAVGRVGKQAGCLLVLDQLDSVYSTRAETLLIGLAAACAQSEGVNVVVLSRKPATDTEPIRNLEKAGFHVVDLTPLTEDCVRSVLDALGLEAWSAPNQRLPLTLLNLEIVGRIMASGSSLDTSTLTDEASLWHAYVEEMEKREAAGATKADGKALTAEAIRLARLGLGRPDRSVLLDRNPSHAQERLLNWHVIRRRTGFVGEFHHEQLQDFYVALDAFDNRLNPVDLASGLDQYKLSGVLVWLDKLYRAFAEAERPQFLRQYLAESSLLTAHGRISVLSQYLHRDISKEPDEVVRALWESIKDQQGLRNKFFSSVPHPSWAMFLANTGVLDSPPAPIKVLDGRMGLPGWDAQWYLKEVASLAPDAVARHLSALVMANAEPHYLGRALDAVVQMSPEQVIPHIGLIVSILTGLPCADRMEVSHPVYMLMLRFANGGMEDPAFVLYEAMTSPKTFATGRNQARTEDGWKVDLASDYYQLFTAEVLPLRRLNSLRFAAMLERQVEDFVRLESEGRERPLSSQWWRSAIDDTDQDDGHDTREKLLVTLRDSLEELSKSDPAVVRPMLSRYLEHEYDIYKRLAIHILATCPDEFSDLVAQVLLDQGHLDDHVVHHEFFRLLHNGFPVLSSSNQEQVVRNIRAGLSTDEKDKIREWVRADAIGDVDEYVARWDSTWIRDRLLMIRDGLSGEDAELLRSLLEQFGTPERPDFLSYHTEGGFVSQISTLLPEQVTAMETEELCQYIANWSPGSRVALLEERTRDALGMAIGTSFIADSSSAQRIYSVSRVDPSVTEGILEYLRGDKNVPTIDWLTWVAVFRDLLDDPSVRYDCLHAHEGGWMDVRLSIAHLLERGLDDVNRMPADLMEATKEILSLLSRDPDPVPREEDPLAESAEHNGPLTQSLNHIRPRALGLRIRYEVYWRNNFAPEGAVKALPEDLATLLENRLDPNTESSLAVRCVLGQHLHMLYYLDPDWTRHHLDQIFPEQGDVLSDKLFVSAWDGFLLESNRLAGPELRKLIQPKLGKALQNLAAGEATTDLDMNRAWACYVLQEYLSETYLPGTAEGKGSLLEEYYAHAPAEAARTTAWLLWVWCKATPQQHWDRAFALWQWRVNQLNSSANASDFASEMDWFTRLPETVQTTVSLRKITSLLHDTIMLAASALDRGVGWGSVQEYLAARATDEPLDAVQMLRVLVEKAPLGYYDLGESERRVVLERAAANENARKDALELIDYFLSKGYSAYSDIYGRYA